ncbi:MAG: protein kinase [Myxococcaceae bacterium]|nr:protein kinase [Myxococcaceae bacterium]
MSTRTCPQCGAAAAVSARQCPACGTILTAAVKSTREPQLPTAMDLPPVPPANLDVGETLSNQWRLDAKVGEGGMGRVFKATELKLGRKVAVKALLNDHLDDDTVKRFEREAQVMARLDHPAVVTLYGVGRHRNIPFLVMKFLEGKSLWGVLDEHGETMPLAVLVPLVRQLLTALGYIHGKGLLHRDLKPSNIFVSPQGKVTLLDLGLARGHSSSLTRTGVIWGTPDFMAPEQIVGERQLDGRADLYALGVVIYRMLAGQPPFPGEDEQELMRAHLTKVRPDVSRVNPAVSTAVSLFVQKAMAIRPEDRFRNAEEMLQALERAVGPGREAHTSAQSPDLPTVVQPLEAPPLGPRPSARPGARRTLDPAATEMPSGPLGGVSDQRTEPERFRAPPDADGTVVVGTSRVPARTVLDGPAAPFDPASGPTEAEGQSAREARTEPSGPFTVTPSEPRGEPSGPSATTLEGTASSPGARVAAWQQPAVLAVGALLILALGVLIGALLR